jgi:uncharacterized short protein YbdD (DUF466 family)
MRLIDALRFAGRRLAQAARLAVGVPDYETYVAHVRAHHPGATPMTRAQFVRERQAARYEGKGPARCC